MDTTLLQKKENDRILGMDLLKILSMIMIIALHIIGNFRVTGKFDNFTYKVCAILYYPLRCAVSCYALTSGFLLINKKYKISRLLYIWIQVFVYSFFIAVAFKIFMRDSISVKEMLFFAFPVTSFKYWYISAYFGLFLLMPLLNLGIRNLSQKQLKITIIAILSVVALSSVLNNILFDTDPFVLKHGMSCLWLIIMYIVGAYVKLYGVEMKFSFKILLLVFFLANAVSLAIYFICAPNGLNYKYLAYYDFPTVIISSISLFLIFAKIKKPVKNKFAEKTITTLSTATLGAYLIHVHPLVYDKLLTKLNVIIHYSNFVFALYLVAAVLGVYIVCSLIDILRYYIFKWIKIDKLCKSADKLVEEKDSDTSRQ